MDTFLPKVLQVLNSAAQVSAGIYGLFFFVAVIGAINDRHECPKVFSSALRYYHQATSSPSVLFHIFFACVSLRFVISLFLHDSFEIGFWAFFFLIALLSVLSSFPFTVSAADRADLADAVTERAEQELSPHPRKRASLTQVIPRRKDCFLSRAEQNLARLERTVSDQLDLLERDLPSNHTPAKPIIMAGLQPYLQHNSEDAKTWGDDFDYATTARTLIFNIAFDTISSGKYHLHTGVINPMDAGPNLLAITCRCLDWAFEHGHITAEEKESTLNTLRENIKSVG